MDEISHRLDFWVRTRGGERLVTEGGEAEERSSPPRAGEHSEQHEQLGNRPAALEEHSLPDANSSTEHDQIEEGMMGKGIKYVNLDKVRPLRGSTVGSCSTAQTIVVGNSGILSKRLSGPQTYDTTAALSDLEANTQPYEYIRRRTSNSLSGEYNDPTEATQSADFSNENAIVRQPSTTVVEGKTAQRNPNFHHAILSSADQPPSEDNTNINAPLNLGGLKRTISTLTFDELTPETRTAFPASEAIEALPAYVRPRSEVGLPALLPGVMERIEYDDDDEDMEQDEIGMA